MKFVQSIFGILICCMVLVGCNPENAATTANEDAVQPKGTTATTGSLTIKGAFTNGNGLPLFLDQVYFNGFNPIEKQQMSDNGGFEFVMPTAEAGIYRLRSGAQNLYLFLNGNEGIVTCSGELSQIQQMNYTVTGSADSKKYQDVFKDLSTNGASEEDISKLIDDLENPLLGAYFAYSAIPLKLLMRYPNPDKMLEIHTKATAKMAAKLSGSRYVTDYNREILQVQTQLSQQKIRVGFEAPDISLPSPKGKNYSLSDLKGKVVLLDFWASWCRPCRRNNPEVVKMYKKYKAQGFTVYSVSLDGIDENTKRRLQYKEDLIAQNLNRTKAAWEQAIQQDNLTWEYHVSDLKKWDCEPAKFYGVQGIPKTFLLDRTGKIAAVNAHGPALEREIQKLL